MQSADADTDVYGIAAANVLAGFLSVGDQEFSATAAGMTVYFDGTTIAPPAISARGVVNAASGHEGQGQAPGSYISFYGSGLSTATKAFGTSYLPLSLAGVSVSFDTTGLSLPGRVHFVSPNQINVQVPWELSGRNTVQTKVSIGDISTAVYTLTLNNYAPAIFQRGGIVAARWNNTHRRNHQSGAAHPDRVVVLQRAGARGPRRRYRRSRAADASDQHHHHAYGDHRRRAGAAG